jgi:4-amino-4-deoxy-L-arabinose transferase-like glycosyltransferase
LLAVGALVLRLYDIERDPLWLDEGYTLLFSGMPLSKLLLVGGAHEHPPLYYLLVHYIRDLNGSYFVPRYISAISGALAVEAVYLLGARVQSRAAGLVAAILVATAPFHVWFSRDGRDYELAGLLVVLSYYFLFSALDERSTRFWVLYAVTTALCLYADYVTAFALLGQALLVLRARREGLTRRLLASWAGVLLLFLPWVAVLAVDATSIVGDYWIRAPNPTLWSGTVLEFLGLMTSCSSQPCTGVESGVPGLAGHEVLLAVVATAAVSLLTVAAVRRRDLTVVVLCAWLLAPFAAILLISIFQSLFLDRVFLDATFPLYLLIGMGVTRLAKNRLTGATAVILAVGIGAAGVTTLRPVYAQNVNPDWPSAMRDFHQAYRAGDAVAYYPGAIRSLLGAYLPAGWKATTEVPMWTRIYVDVPGWQNQYPHVFHATKQRQRELEAGLRDRQLGAAAKRSPNIWLITQDYSGLSDTRHWFATHGYQLLLGEEYANDARIELWSRSSPAGMGMPLSWLGQPQLHGPATIHAGLIRERSGGSILRRFTVSPGQTYFVPLQYRGVPPADPSLGVLLYDSQGKQIGSFPRIQWYDLPVNGAWLSNPFGFVAPPGSAGALLYASSSDGPSEWRFSVYQER